MCENGRISDSITGKKGDVMRFENYNNKVRHPFVIYADFESTLKRIGHGYKTRIQVASSYDFYVSYKIYAFTSKYDSFVGEDAAEQLIKQLLIGEEVDTIVKTNKPMIMTAEAVMSFKHAQTCHICEKKH